MRIGLLREKINSLFRVQFYLAKAIKAYSRSTGSTHLTPEVDGGEWLISDPSRFAPGK